MVFTYTLILLLSFPIFIYGNCGLSVRCQCGNIPNASIGRLSEIDSAKHLSHRQTFSAGLTISDTCKVTVDISKSTVDNFFLVFVRDPENPLIFRRFTKSMDKSVPVELTDLKCVKEGNEYKWYHGPVKVADSFEATLLSDEECGCSIPTDGQIEVTQLDGSCNAFQWKCPGTMIPSLGREILINPLIRAVSQELTVVETTCVNGSVYFEGTILEDPKLFCNSSSHTSEPEDVVNFVNKCRCVHDFASVAITWEDINEQEEYWDAISKLLSITGDLKNRTSVNGTATLNITDCTVRLACPESKTPTVLSLNYRPIMYEPNESPIIQCADPPASHAFSQATDRKWWAKGVPVNYLRYTCY